MKKIIFGILALVIGGVSFFSIESKSQEIFNDDLKYKILQKWELPKALNEVSGIAWIGNDRIACIQDEDGIIYIYNLETSRVDAEIKFAKGGDYEGIAVIKDNAYVLRSDGVIFEVAGYKGANPKVKMHVTGTNELPGINLEGLCADPENSRLLLAVKDGKDFQDRKGVYAFNLDQNASDNRPLFQLDLSDPIFDKVDGKLKNKFAPGAINIHPETGELYILDGSLPKLLITEKDGSPRELIMLKSEDFGNPEGLTFSSSGDLYISNEAASGPANILKISLNRRSK